ncbi:MAG: glycosyltransferase [Candidatus Falkowbacteria bacterium]
MELQKNKSIAFCLPVYNEEKILKENTLLLLHYCNQANFTFDWLIVILVNGSNDNSWEIAKDLSINHKKIIAINYKFGGRGNALKSYWQIATADIVTYMDIDLAVDLDDIQSLINPIIKNEYDLVVGSRLLANSKIKRSLLREITSQSCHLFSRLMLGHHFSDLQCGFKAIKTSSFRKISHYIIDKKWFFDTELAVYAQIHKLNVKEIAVNWSENRYDNRRNSKINIFRDSIKFISNYIKFKRRLLKEAAK